MLGVSGELTEIDEQALLTIAQEAAQAAAAELTGRFGHRVGGVRAKSGPTDLVSDADLAAEAAIRSVLAQRRAGDAILGEEGGASGDGELRWVVDPLDGTINFLFGIPTFAVSVACEDAAGAIVGVVLDPSREESFAATRSGRATLNGEPIRAPLRDELATAMVATGFSYDAKVRARQAQVLSQVLPRVRDIRRAGAAAIDLAWCAIGRHDAFYERGLNAWDVAAGCLIVTRAGLEVRDLAPTALEPGGVLVAPPALIDELHRLVTIA
ncbi:MAG: inositol monophosphatase family protein [Solirubrobacteraceae bacterium]|jgi:myo-inositol-1(or 4)-monophosphatase